jgi:large subunit ribosomal protein L20
MSRVKRGNVARKRRKKVLKAAEGFIGSTGKLFRTANQRLLRAGVYSYNDRAKRKSEMRKLWISRTNAMVRKHGWTYSEFMHALNINSSLLNRKTLSQLSVLDPKAIGYINTQVSK